MSGAAEIIGQAITRIAGDYDLALMQAAGDESMVTMHLPAEWAILTRRVCELIFSEVSQRYAGDGAPAAGLALISCTACAGRLFCVTWTPAAPLLREVRCAGCGTVTHV